MSDCCCHPGVGPNPTDLTPPNYSTYRPGELRLYGRPAPHAPIFVHSEEEALKRLENDLHVNNIESDTKKIAEIARKSLAYSLDPNNFLGIFKEKITLAGLLGFDIYSLPVEISSKKCCDDDKGRSIGVIYGYSYEGHCYDLPKPLIMFLPCLPHQLTSGYCECDCGYGPGLGYAVWQIDKLEDVVVIDIRVDDVKTLILDANLPGNRSPLAYSQTMRLAPSRPPISG